MQAVFCQPGPLDARSDPGDRAHDAALAIDHVQPALADRGKTAAPAIAGAHNVVIRSNAQVQNASSKDSKTRGASNIPSTKSFRRARHRQCRSSCLPDGDAETRHERPDA